MIVPARDAMPGITRAVTSAMEQTLGLSRLDIIAVDDGSADGTAEELDRLAAGCPSLHVVRNPHPCRGGTGGPRNTGLARATGDFVFFLDADARLAPDALRRMVAMASPRRSSATTSCAPTSTAPTPTPAWSPASSSGAP